MNAGSSRPALLSRRVLTVALALGAARASAQGSIAGVVYDSLTTHAPLAGATVVLVEPSRYATTDAHGRFRIDSVPAGRYTLGFTHAALEALDLALPTVPVAVVDGRRAAVTLASPSVATVYARLCPEPRESETGVILGRVSDVDDHTPLAGATISTDWTEFMLTGSRSSRERVRAAARTDPKGTYLLCGVPTGVPLDVSGELAGFTAGPTSLTLDSSVIHRVDLAISRRDSAALGAMAGDSSRRRTSLRGTASLRGVVLGADGRPLRGAEVGVIGLTDSARTDAAGAFHIEGIPAGTRSVQARSIGWLPTTVSMDFATNGLRDATLSLSRKAQDLSPVAVDGRARSTSPMELSGFETRREHALGSFIIAQDIAKHNFSDLGSILRGVRGVHIEYLRRNGLPPLPIPLFLGVSDLKSNYCAPNVFLDGSPFIGSFDDLTNMVRPPLIRGIEVYDSPGEIPAQYDLTSSTGCGSIVVWTH